MAVVLSSEESKYFSSTLRRSHSQPKFTGNSSTFQSTASASRVGDSYSRPARVFAGSAPSSAPSSPRLNQGDSTDLSCSSTPASNLSIECDDTVQLSVDPEDHFVLPDYSRADFIESAEDLEPPTSPKTGDSYTVSPADHDTSATTSRPGTPDIVVEHADDDTAIRAQPSRHVDYLSHNWKEEDIWSSWKYVISRRGEVANASRLENASWRTWMKAKNNLRTVSPETLNWLKDCDVTWLYGPLQLGNSTLAPNDTELNGSRLSKTNSFIDKKPILKKRSMSEIMLQRSLSTSSLVKQAAAAVQAQEKDGGARRGSRPGLERAATDYGTFHFSSRRISQDDTACLVSLSSSGLGSPMNERRHIHFNEQVEQCIAVDVKGDDDDLDADIYGDSDSDEGPVMMKRTKGKKRAPALRKRSNTGPVPAEGKTIAMLPSTTLKCREDTPEPDTAMKHSFRSPVMSPSSSQETLRAETLKPSIPSRKFFIDEEDEDEDDNGDEDEDDDPNPSLGWQCPDAGKDANGHTGEPDASLRRTPSGGSLNAEPEGMRRTASGMFMPYEEGESSSNNGVFGRVIDTVNTARDIAHVIWNVGWRK